MAADLPFLSFAGLNLLTLADQLGQNARATQTALESRVIGRVAKVVGYAATGATTTRIALPLSILTPYAVQVCRVQLRSDPAADITVVPRYNFAVTSTNMWVYEPGGLVLNNVYDLTFLIMEA